MDVLAHALWTFVVFHRTEDVLLAMLFGILPDLIWFAAFQSTPAARKITWKKPNLKLIPAWTNTVYTVTHSFLSVAAAFGLTYVLLGRIPMYFWAYPMHILFDIPTHSRNFFPTPFLWPVSRWTFPGINWGNPVFMAVNYGSLVVALLVVLI